MQARTLRRLEQLEGRRQSIPEKLVTFGRVKRLPDGYRGERHIALVKRNTPQGGEYEERLGVAPGGLAQGGPSIILSEDEMRI